ncbi:DUF1990 family protein [Segniliparus rugosus]|uniref:DUF1990 domain-containing protein n=1 Tax=Segniliparus rugosus (strain ATCC BAA-974 / DSM 45345 / CCUG 50838 / CIP 108380 / JCM 13579 / CDC 945) TaxID=679197 RepID=E5XL74_SEGRC|nr:DUF1990 domain-containing protein [Segniliparus rugosus]EFV14942.2 hypothetical protein HMPREF9336_00243 [Segniliparus rugosus ATCC BAA-974]
MSFRASALSGRYVPLPEDRARVLRAAPFTYSAQGATRGETDRQRFFLPLAASKAIGTGEARFHRAAAAVLTWQAQRGAGITVRASASFVAEGEVVDQRVGPVSAPCRVVYVVDEPRRKGFAYGTLPGHPERGEERFLVSWDPQTDEVRVEVSSISLPSGPWLLALPVLRVVQRFFVRRFLLAVERASR